MIDIQRLPLGPMALLLLALAGCGQEQPPSTDRTPPAAQAAPAWIWAASELDADELLFRRTFEHSDPGVAARIVGTCDNWMVVSLNGVAVGAHGAWEEVVAGDVTELLTVGENRLEVRARNEGGPAGLCLRLELDGRPALVTDGAWQVAPPERADGEGWSPVAVLGAVGAAQLPWSGKVTLASFDDPGRMASGDPEAPQAPTPVDSIALLPGFEAELLYSVHSEHQGSWVSLATDPRGRLYASDERGRGLHRITPAAPDDPDALTLVEPINVDVSGAQGMCWAFDSLYVNAAGQGVYRLRDTDGDDRLDDAELLIEIGDAGEHGPHAIVPSADGEGLWFVGGNHTRPPDFERSRAPSNWGEDLLLPRQWDPSGHARGRLAPGGWIARCASDGTEIEIISTGYRNQYDIAAAPDGELFTYDADMEWDLGLPWYRPTRICHVTSGSEFGWRAGSGKWPSHYEDSLPAALEIGPGSPTGLLFGTGAAFPARYQRALYALDWTFGTIYAIHLEPSGSSYTATKEEFAFGKPLALTDAVVGVDGALYFTVGGRGIQSALYRVRYVGEESTEPATASPGERSARDARRALESFHARIDPAALDAAWPALSSEDRFLRFAARVAIESQPVESWRERALSEGDPRARAVALIALARQGAASDRGPLLAALAALDLATLDEEDLLIALRAFALSFTRHGAPTPEERRLCADVLEPLLPHDSPPVNAELVRLLVYLEAPGVVAKALDLMTSETPEPLPAWAELIERNDSYGRPIAKMLADLPPVRALGIAFPLRNAVAGWTPALRERYFEFVVEASEHPGGHSYARFLENMRDDAASGLTPAERRVLADLIGAPLMAAPPADIEPPRGPGRQWSLEEAVAAVGSELTERDLESGRNLYHAAACSMCHRFDGQGGAMGPDLTSVANNFSIPDLLEAIVEPSKVISDQYGSHTVTTHDGRSAVGILVESEDEVTIYPRAVDAEPASFPRSEVATIAASTTSQMPAGLVDALSPEELRDLIAYLLAGGEEP